ncbi:Uncharacterized protein HZ326_29982 [Fusarium oxysporum f. sp. albedinis]|nr:Uncharacterized protein HZ326_29982 [Fusarium oxysporum f. sp. albedinis]
MVFHPLKRPRGEECPERPSSTDFTAVGPLKTRSSLADVCPRTKKIGWLSGSSARSPWAILRPTVRSALVSRAC